MHRLFGITLQYFVAEISVIETSATARRALLAATAAFHDDLQRQAHQRADVGIEQAVAARHQHHIVFSRQAGHHLRHARVERARHAFQLFQQRDFLFRLETGDGVMRQVQRVRFTALEQRCLVPAALACDSAGGLRRLFQRGQGDVIGIGEGGLVAAHGAHADALVDVKTAGLDYALFQRPALGAAVLEIQVGVIHLVRQHGAEHVFQVTRFQTVPGEQCALRQLQGGTHAEQDRVRCDSAGRLLRRLAW